VLDGERHIIPSGVIGDDQRPGFSLRQDAALGREPLVNVDGEEIIIDQRRIVSLQLRDAAQFQTLSKCFVMPRTW
jgi:hypothetical protein